MFPQYFTTHNSSIVETRQEAALSFQEEKNSGEYGCRQSQLCSDGLKIRLQSQKEKIIHKKNFSVILITPFGKATIRFIYCPKQNRYNRFVCGGGKYIDLLKKLDKEFNNRQDRINIYEQLLSYLSSPPVYNSDPWNNPGFISNYQNKSLAYFCAILAVCDPCFGEGANGGKDIRALLRSDKCLNGCSFKTFLRPSRYPLSQKGAYALARRLLKTEKIKGELGTLKGFKRLTNKYSPLKFKIKRCSPALQHKPINFD